MENIIINLDSNEFLSNIKTDTLTCIILNLDNQNFFRSWLQNSYDLTTTYNPANNIIFVYPDNLIIGFGGALIGSIETYTGDENRMEVHLVYDYVLSSSNNVEVRRLVRERKINNLI